MNSSQQKSRNSLLVLLLAACLFSEGVFAAGRVTVHGKVWLEQTPVCALVLSNGQSMFSCDPRGEYSLDVPLGSNGEVTVFGFASGQEPYQRTFTPGSDSVEHNIYMTAAYRPAKTKRIGYLDFLDSATVRDVSADGRYSSYSVSSLLGEARENIKIYDRANGNTIAIQLPEQGPRSRHTGGDMSPDGRYLGLGHTSAEGAGFDQSWVYDTVDQGLTLLSARHDGGEADGNCGPPLVSGAGKDGHWAVFPCDAANIVQADANGTEDIFVRNLDSGATSRLDIDTDLNDVSYEPLTISNDGSRVLFFATGTPLGGSTSTRTLYLYNRELEWTSVVDIPVSEDCGAGQTRMSGQGREIVFTTKSPINVTYDTNGECDVYLYDLDTREFTLISLRTEGVGDLESHELDPVTLSSNGASYSNSVSDDGRYVSFTSEATNLLNHQADRNEAADVFLYYRVNKKLSLASHDTGDLQSIQGATLGILSGDGAWIAMSASIYMDRPSNMLSWSGNFPFLRGPLYQRGNR